MCPTVSLPLGRKREPHTFVPDVPSSVNVAVMGATAQGARPLPNRQVLGSREAVAALMTELARREQPTDGDETLAPVFELVAEKGAEHAEAVVHRGLAELQAPGHAPHVKILHAHAVGYRGGDDPAAVLHHQHEMVVHEKHRVVIRLQLHR